MGHYTQKWRIHFAEKLSDLSGTSYVSFFKNHDGFLQHVLHYRESVPGHHFLLLKGLGFPNFSVCKWLNSMLNGVAHLYVSQRSHCIKTLLRFSQLLSYSSLVLQSQGNERLGSTTCNSLCNL